jgi:hypothetical protein
MIHATQLYIMCIGDLRGPEKINNTGRTTKQRENDKAYHYIPILQNKKNWYFHLLSNFINVCILFTFNNIAHMSTNRGQRPLVT